uniref:Uncharacterized protein n=1 Tax=Babesia bovis TaxID=5865 RepID=A7AMC6_BABBO|eukprot:XP_001611278.1 hypothetical protein [Babesia bovis T2Bo]
MKYNGQLIYPNVYRITPKCTEKSIYKTLLKDTANNFLKQIAESQIQQISPFDAAAVLKRLLENVDSKGVIEIRRNPYYKPVVTRILNSVELYRKELLFYFLNKFYQLHDTQAIKHLTQVFVESQAVSLLNPNQLVELTYYAAHHIPKEVKQEVEYADIPKEELAVYHKYIKQLQGELVAKAVELKDYNLIYKVVIALPKLPKTQYTDVLSRVIAEKGECVLFKCMWTPS